MSANERYTPDGPTVRQHIQTLEGMIRMGGIKDSDHLLILDPDAIQWVPVTGFTYGNGNVKLYSDGD